MGHAMDRFNRIFDTEMDNMGPLEQGELGLGILTIQDGAPIAAVLDEPAAPAPQDHALVAAVLEPAAPTLHNVAPVAAILAEPAASAPREHALVAAVIEPAAPAFQNVVQVAAVLDEPTAPAPQDDALVAPVLNEQAGDLWDQLVQQNAVESSSDEEGDDGATLDNWRAEGEDIEFHDSTQIQFRCSACLGKLKRFVFGCGHSFCGECTERLHDRFRTSVCAECRTTVAVDPLRLHM